MTSEAKRASFPASPLSDEPREKRETPRLQPLATNRHRASQPMETAMTSELRHPVYVWRDACIAYGGLSIEGTDAEYKAAAVIEADREAVRAPLLAEIERLTIQLEVESEPSPYCPICGSCGEDGCCGPQRCLYPTTVQAAELAKFKALAETLAGALGQIEEGTYPRPLGKPWRMDASSSKHDRCIHDAWMYEACEACIDAFAAEALREYKEARDEAPSL